MIPDDDLPKLKALGVREHPAAGHAAGRDRRDDPARRRRARTALSATARWSSGPFRRASTRTICRRAARATGFRSARRCPPASASAAILERLQQLTRYAWDTSPFYRRKWDEAGFHPDHLRSLEDFEAKVPVITKKDLRDAQARVPPFGDYLCVPDAKCHHIHGTSGTTGRPTAFAIGRADWDAIANAHARIMWGMGIRPGDMVFVAAIFSLYMGSWGALSGAERLRAKAFPFGAGAPGMTARAAMWLDLDEARRALRDAVVRAASGGSRAQRRATIRATFGLKTMFFSGEPGASVPGVRDRIVDAYGARVIDCGSMAEMTPFMNVAGTAETDGMLCWQDIVYTEVCDPQTYRRVPYGQRGTPVYTHLERTSQPMIRLASGDLTLWENEPNPCGRTYPRLPQGIFGRIDDMFTIRGENVYPSEVDAVLNELPGYGGEHRIVITRDGAMDELVRARRDRTPSMRRAAQAAHAALARRGGAQRCRQMLGLRAKVEIVAPGTFPRTDFKARRVIDDREVFREMNARLGMRRRPMALHPVDASSCRACSRGDVRAIARLLTRAESGVDRGAADARRDVRARGTRARHRHHRRARAAASRRSSRSSPRRCGSSGRKVGDRRRRSVEPVLRRRDPRRPHPDERPRRRPGRLRPQHGDARRARRPRARHARGGRRARRGGLRHRHHRDGRRGPGRGRDRPRRAHDGRRLRAGARRRHPGDQGRHPRDRRHPRRQQVRPARREPDDRRSRRRMLGRSASRTWTRRISRADRRQVAAWSRRRSSRRARRATKASTSCWPRSTRHRDALERAARSTRAARRSPSAGCSTAGEAILRERFARHRDGKLVAMLEQLRARTLSPRTAARALLREMHIGGDA